MIIIINYLIKYAPQEISPITTYTPDEPVIDKGDTVPENLKDPIKQAIAEYFDYCNSGNYEDAFAMLTDDCKEYLYDNNVEKFKIYVDSIFDQDKIYSLQNFSNKDDVYVYEISILDNILATGTNGYDDDFYYYVEKMAAIQEGDTVKLTNNNYIRKEELNITANDQYVRFAINYRQVSYDTETYNVTIRNNSEYYVVLYDGTVSASEIQLNVADIGRNVYNIDNVYLLPNQTKTFNLNFEKFYDEDSEDEGIMFNTVRVLKHYYGYTPTDSSQLKEEAIKLYSLTYYFSEE